MVIRVAKDGGEWEVPPYTEEEEWDLHYRLNCPPIQVMHGSRTIVPQPPRPAKNDPPQSQKEEQSQSPTQSPEK